MDYGQLNWVRSWPTTKPFALSPSKGMPGQGQGFDQLSPNGGVEGLRPAQYSELGRKATTKPFALSPSKGMPGQGQGFDQLSPNGVWKGLRPAQPERWCGRAYDQRSIRG
jgi:hypothetical protein